MKLKNDEFLLNSEHKAVVAGKSRRLYDTGLNQREWLIIISPLALIFGMLLVLIMFWLMFQPQISNYAKTSIFALIFMFLFGLLPPAYKRIVQISTDNYSKIFQRWMQIRRLENKGILFDGKIISCTIDAEHQLKLRYGFRNPAEKFIEGEISRYRPDLEEKTIPDAGTYITVIYVDDTCFMLL